MYVVQNIFQSMLPMSRVAMITTREPQEEMIFSRLSARNIQASEHSIPVPLVWRTKLNYPQRHAFTETLFKGPPQENYIGKLCTVIK